jgi:hypothetical protein
MQTLRKLDVKRFFSSVARPQSAPQDERERRKTTERTGIRRVIEFTVCIGFGVIVYAFTSDISQAAFLQAISGFCGLMIGFQAQYFFQNLHSESRIQSVQDDLDTLKDVVKQQGDTTRSTVELHERIGRIQDSLRTEQQFERLASFNDLLRDIDRQKSEVTAALAEHISWKERRIITSAMGQLEKLSTGTIEIDDSDRELITNSEFLLSLAKERVRAVSFQDEAFWSSPEGEHFLEAHQSAKASGIKISRVFVLTGTPSAPTVQTIQKQLQQGLDVYVHIATEAELSLMQDFVIYDANFIRLGLVPQIGPFDHGRAASLGLSKFARLTNNQDEVQQFEYRFEALRRKAFPASSWLSRQDNTELCRADPPPT